MTLRNLSAALPLIEHYTQQKELQTVQEVNAQSTAELNIRHLLKMKRGRPSGNRHTMHNVFLYNKVTEKFSLLIEDSIIKKTLSKLFGSFAPVSGLFVSFICPVTSFYT